MALLTQQPQVRFTAFPWNFQDVTEVYRQHLERGKLEYVDRTIFYKSCTCTTKKTHGQHASSMSGCIGITETLIDCKNKSEKTLLNRARNNILNFGFSCFNLKKKKILDFW